MWFGETDMVRGEEKFVIGQTEAWSDSSNCRIVFDMLAWLCRLWGKR